MGLGRFSFQRTITLNRVSGGRISLRPPFYRSLRTRINLRKFQLVSFHFLAEPLLHI